MKLIFWLFFGQWRFKKYFFWDLLTFKLHNYNHAIQGIDGIFRLACLLFIWNNRVLGYDILGYEMFMGHIQWCYLNREGHKKLYIGFVRPEGGTTNNGF